MGEVSLPPCPRVAKESLEKIRAARTGLQALRLSHLQFVYWDSDHWLENRLSALEPIAGRALHEAGCVA